MSIFFIALLFPARGISAQHSYVFCHECYENTHDLITDRVDTNDQKLVDTLIEFEDGLNVSLPEKSKIPFRIIGSGSTTLGLVLDPYQDKLIRRLPGFYTYHDAVVHIGHIQEYRKRLHALGIATTDTQLVALESKRHSLGERWNGGQGIVYVIQPYLKGKRLAKNYLHQAKKQEIKDFFNKQIKVATKILEYNDSNPKEQTSLDIVLNNWELHFLSEDSYTLRFNDIAQPLFTTNGIQPYNWYDQAASVVLPFISDTQKELKEQFEKLQNPREFLTEMLWGYDSLKQLTKASTPRKTAISTPEPLFELKSEPTSLPETVKCDQHSPYPDWAMKQVNQLLKQLKYPELTGQEVYTAFKNNNYALACFRLFRDDSASIRYVLSYLWLANNLYLTKPDDAPMDMYGTSEKPGLLECYRNPDKKY